MDGFKLIKKRHSPKRMTLTIIYKALMKNINN